MSGAARLLVTLGLLLVAAGLIVGFFPKLPGWLGRLPGDINIRRDNFSLHIPLTTCLLVSALFSFIAWLFRR